MRQLLSLLVLLSAATALGAQVGEVTAVLPEAGRAFVDMQGLSLGDELVVNVRGESVARLQVIKVISGIGGVAEIRPYAAAPKLRPGMIAALVQGD